MKHSRNVQVSLTARHCLVISSQNLQCVSKVAASFGFSQLISNSPEQKVYILVHLNCKINNALLHHERRYDW